MEMKQEELGEKRKIGREEDGRMGKREMEQEELEEKRKTGGGEEIEIGEWERGDEMRG
jgi:hypothetical protein